MNTLKIDEKWSVEYDPAQNNRPVRMVRDGEPQPPFPPNRWPVEAYGMFYALLEARQVRNETAEADRPLEPQTIIHECLTNKDWGHGIEESALAPELRSEGTHIHAALLAQDATGLFVTGLNAEDMEELRVLGQRTGGLIEFNPGKRKPMDSAGDLIRNYPDLATDLAADSEFTAAFLKEVRKRGIPHFDPANPSLVIRTNNDFRTVAKTLVEHDLFVVEFLNAMAQQIKDREVL